MTLVTKPETHYTAWLTTDSTCLDGACSDVTVLADELSGHHHSTGEAQWVSAGDPLLHTVTTVSAKDGDDEQAMQEAQELLKASGWSVDGQWEAVPTGFIIPVKPAAERVFALVSAQQGDLVTGVEISSPESPLDWPSLTRAVQTWATTQGYGDDDAELLYVLAEGDEIPDEFPHHVIVIPN
ncbi:hypothetical protein [Streptomyces sp. NPDC005953]|uniref:hypothetical protein n=1 Tax=Streptomyces sp. NPDC005953 TaxID=3156719 RepID=UPI0033FA0FF6